MLDDHGTSSFATFIFIAHLYCSICSHTPQRIDATHFNVFLTKFSARYDLVRMLYVYGHVVPGVGHILVHIQHQCVWLVSVVLIPLFIIFNVFCITDKHYCAANICNPSCRRSLLHTRCTTGHLTFQIKSITNLENLTRSFLCLLVFATH